MAYFGQSYSDDSLFGFFNKKGLLGVWIAGVVGGFFLLMYSGAFESTSEAPLPVVNSPLQAVVVPRERIPAGVRISGAMLTVEQKIVTGIEDRVARTIPEIEGSYAVAPLVEGEPVFHETVSRIPPMNALTAKIPAGFRAVTISVNAESGVEGWVQPGVLVDVVWVSTIRGKQSVSVIVEGAKVLSAQQSTEAAPNDPGRALPTHVTIMATAADTQRIQLAKASGILTLSLRGASDRAIEGPNTITTDNLLDKDMREQEVSSEGSVTLNGVTYRVSPRGELIKEP